MKNWTYFATYEKSSTDVRALPQSFSELFITTSTNSSGSFLAAHIHFLIPQIIIPNVNSVDQSLTLVDYQFDKSNVLRIWSGGMMVLETDNTFSYDVYYR